MLDQLLKVLIKMRFGVIALKLASGFLKFVELGRFLIQGSRMMTGLKHVV